MSYGLVGVVVQKKRNTPAIKAKRAMGIKDVGRIRSHSYQKKCGNYYLILYEKYIPTKSGIVTAVTFLLFF
jgi:hypothetical protein